MAKYELELEANELLGLLSTYFSEITNKPVEVKVKLEKKYTGFYDDEETVVSFYYQETIDILGKKAIKKNEFSMKDIKEILSELIETSTSEYKVSKITETIRFKDKGPDYYNTLTPYFEKVTVELKEREKELKRKITYEKI